MINLKTYLKFLSRNKLYTFVSVAGFSISLMFVIILGLYVKQELSVDDFNKNKDRIFMIANGDGTESYLGNPVPQFVKDNYPEVESYVRVLSQGVAIGKKDDDKLKVKALFADSTFYQIFSFKLIEGNPSQALESRKSVVLTQNFAIKNFGTVNPVGKTLVIDGVEHTITGVMENMPHNTMLPDADIVVNYNSIVQYWGNQVLETNNNFGFSAFFLEKEGANFVSKAPEVLELFKKNFWVYEKGFTKGLRIVSLKDAYFMIKSIGYGNFKNNDRTPIMVYLTISILILIIALLNYINLTVAQAGFRGKESAIKKLLGSSKSNIIFQLLSESLLMTSFTFLLGVLLAFLVEPFFNNVLSASLDLAHQFTPLILGFCIVFVLLISLIAGIIPAIIISNFKPIEVVKGTFSRKIKSTYSKVLIIFQYTVSMALLICSVFIQRQSDFLINYDMGYNRDGILEIGNNAIAPKQLDGFRAKLNEIPGIDLISFSCGTPLSGGNNNSFELDGEQLSFQEFYVDSTFFKIYGITIEPTEVPASDSTYWLNAKGYNAVHVDPKTQTFSIWGGADKAQVAGIFSDFKIRTLEQNYDLLRIRQRKVNEWPWDIIVKMTPGTDYFKTAKQIESAFDSYTNGEMFDAKFVDEKIQQNYEKVQKTSSIMSAFTLLTIVIMIMGVFAMSLYLIRQKEKEIALRKINGATVNEILTLLNKDSLIRIAIAFVFACPIAFYAMTKWFENFPIKISLSWWVFVVAGLAVLLLTLVSVSYVTWRAARANPVESLKGE